MSISRKKFDAGDFASRKYKRDEHPIAVFLKKNNARAFTIKEVIKELKMKPSTVRGMLRELKKDGLIVHKSPYIAWKKK